MAQRSRVSSMDPVDVLRFLSSPTTSGLGFFFCAKSNGSLRHSGNPYSLTSFNRDLHCDVIIFVAVKL